MDFLKYSHIWKGVRNRKEKLQAERATNAKALRQKQACSRHKAKTEKYTNDIWETGNTKKMACHKIWELYSYYESEHLESF